LSFPCEVVPKPSSKEGLLLKRQKTLKGTLFLKGKGLFTGESVDMRISPAQSGTGILFQRNDIPTKPCLAAHLNNVKGTPRCTILGKDGVYVQTVEHLLAALRALEIDNALIEISGPEIPIFDGSAEPIIQALEDVGVLLFEEPRQIFQLTAPIYWSQGDVHLVALPSDEYRISYTLQYPHSTLLRSQFYSFVMHQDSFKREIAPCRTFCLYEEVMPMIEKGMIKGGGLDNAIIIKNDEIVNPEGIRFSDEMVRHKILDMIGDFSLIEPFLAHVIAIRSGHTSNVLFARMLLNHFKLELA